MKARCSVEYDILWRIGLDANSPKDAAEKALEVQRDSSSESTVFDVIDENGKAHTVDLETGEISDNS